jgi:hypothetical protein
MLELVIKLLTFVVGMVAVDFSIGMVPLRDYIYRTTKYA